MYSCYNAARTSIALVLFSFVSPVRDFSMSNLCNFFSNMFLNFRVIISFSKAGVSLAIKYYGIIYISFIFVYASERNLSGKDSLKRRALSENAFIYFSLLL